MRVPVCDGGREFDGGDQLVVGNLSEGAASRCGEFE